MMVGDRLRQLRTMLGLSQYQMADLLDMARSTYAHYETGDRKPNPAFIRKVTTRTGVSADWLLGISDDTFSEIKDNKAPANWRELVAEALKRDGWDPDRVTMALRILDTLREEKGR